MTFILAVAFLTAGVMGWQQRRARRAAASGEPRRVPGAATIISLSSLLAPATLATPVRVAILRDSASELYYDRRATMDSIVSTWRDALTAIGAQVRVVSPREAVGTSDEQVIIVPASPCLGRDARHALDIATRRGTGMVVTWLSGIRDGGCRRVGYGFIAQVTRATRLDTLQSTGGECYITFLPGGPLATDIPPGTRLELAVANHVALRSPRREAYFSDYTLNPRDAGGEALVDGAIIQTTVGAARAVYWGFDLTSVVDRPWERAIALRLTRNSIAWAARVPLATIEPWPNGKAVVAVFAEDVEDEFTNGQYALDSLRAAHVPGTYFMVSRLAQRNAALARAMAAQGEAGSHTPRHRLLGGLSARDQQKALDETQQELADVVGHRVSGLRPPEEQFDAATLAAWRRTGGGYMFASLNGRVASPEIFSTESGSLVLLGRVTNDDFIEVARRGLTNVDSLAAGFLAGFEKVRALGGLYILSYHSQMLARPELVPALARVVRRVNSDTTVWITTAGAVADWWLARSLVRPMARQISPRQFIVDVHNGGRTAVRGVVVRIAIGPGQVRSADGGARLLASDDDDVRVLMPELPAGVTTRTTLTVGSEPSRIAARASPQRQSGHDSRQ